MTAEGFWAKPELLNVEEDPTAVQLGLWRAGFLQAEVHRLGNEELPTSIVARFQPATTSDSETPGPSGRVECPRQNRTWRCPVPAALLDLRLSTAGYGSQYRWDVEVPPAGTVDLGKLSFRRGFAVIGWVVTEGAHAAAGTTQIQLTPRLAAPQRSTPERVRIGRTSLSTTTNRRGFFELYDVPAGQYVIEATQKPFAPARATVEVLADQVTEIRDPPLILRAPRTFEAVVDPPVAPSGELWQIDLVEIDRSSTTIAVFDFGMVPQDGVWRAEGVPPARYRLTLGLPGEASWFSRELEIPPDQEPLFVTLPVVEVRGTVYFGEDPLAATLWFGRKNHPVSVPLSSDADGRFQGFLPRDGMWDLDVIGEEPSFQRSLQNVEVTRRHGRSYAEIELRLPNTILTGVVVDERAFLVTDAIVTAQSLDEIVPATRLKTDEAGSFEIYGLPSGLTSIVAEASRHGQDLYSDEVQVDLTGDRPADVRLILQPALRIVGRVVANGRGVPGARIKAEPSQVFGLPIFTDSTTTDGAFELRLPATTQDYFLSVAAPGFGFRFFRVPVATEQPVIVPVTKASGSLVIELPDSVDRRLWNAPGVFLYHQGALESLGYLLFWAAFNGQQNGDAQQRLLIPGMEPGEYRACLIHSSRRLAVLEGGSDETCVTGYLPHAGQLELSFPDPKS